MWLSIAAPKVLRVRVEVLIGGFCDGVWALFAISATCDNAKVLVAPSLEFSMLVNETLKVCCPVTPFDFLLCFGRPFVLFIYVLRKVPTRTKAK